MVCMHNKIFRARPEPVEGCLRALKDILQQVQDERSEELIMVFKLIKGTFDENSINVDVVDIDYANYRYGI